jgi:hypothetical protein
MSTPGKILRVFVMAAISGNCPSCNAQPPLEMTRLLRVRPIGRPLVIDACPVLPCPIRKSCPPDVMMVARAVGSCGGNNGRTEASSHSGEHERVPGRRLSQQCIRKCASDVLTPSARRSLVSCARRAARAADETRSLPRAALWPDREWPHRRSSGARSRRSASCAPLPEISARHSRRSS